VTDIKVNDGYWHFLCVTWENKHGFWNVFVDGMLKDSGVRLARGAIVQGTTCIIIMKNDDYVKP